MGPGGFIGSYGYVNNLLRPLVSTQAGLKKVTRPYCMKLRSYLLFQSKKFLSYYQQFPERDEKYIFFKNSVIVTSFFLKSILPMALLFFLTISYQ
ncbi:WavE lipopolysaccharide synthesis family protein [Brevinema andersonii]|uniref:WavE lipopolysaccharide synthesis family protein n=1 Tax=Brevinema andersonii TaxID=34097 RepID=UPI0013563CD0